ncbi:MAG: DUF4145 domain-containing protein [Acidobacteriota bacterium]|nr:DUF4145 domain-containing protein [Acidobacteriota bacterium]
MAAKIHNSWEAIQGVEARTYTCGYCGKIVASDRGWKTGNAIAQPQKAQIYICPLCKQSTYFYGEEQTPGVAYGNEVSHLPNDIASLYREARNSVAARAYTASVLTCRKLLMNIAVAQGADEGKSFLHYVEYLASQGYVPPNGRGWVDHIRKKGNEANHEIILMSRPDAEELILFTEMLLKFVYEFPNRVPAAPAPTSSP